MRIWWFLQYEGCMHNNEENTACSEWKYTFQRNSEGNQEGKSARGRGVGPLLLLLLLLLLLRTDKEVKWIDVDSRYPLNYDRYRIIYIFPQTAVAQIANGAAIGIQHGSMRTIRHKHKFANYFCIQWCVFFVKKTAHLR